MYTYQEPWKLRLIIQGTLNLSMGCYERPMGRLGGILSAEIVAFELI